MTKAELVQQVQRVHGNLSRREASVAVDAIWDTIKQGLLQGQGIQIKGFGRFVVRFSAPRVGRDMNTGQAVPISARRVVVFRPSNQLKQLVGGG